MSLDAVLLWPLPRPSFLGLQSVMMWATCSVSWGPRCKVLHPPHRPCHGTLAPLESWAKITIPPVSCLCHFVTNTLEEAGVKLALSYTSRIISLWQSSSQQWACFELNRTGPVEEANGNCHIAFIKISIPFSKAAPTGHNHLLKATLLKTSVGNQVSTHKFWKDTSIKMITALKYASPLEAFDPFKHLCSVVGPPCVGTTRYFWKVPIMLVRFKKKLTDMQASAQNMQKRLQNVLFPYSNILGVVCPEF